MKKLVLYQLAAILVVLTAFNLALYFGAGQSGALSASIIVTIPICIATLVFGFNTVALTTLITADVSPVFGLAGLSTPLSALSFAVPVTILVAIFSGILSSEYNLKYRWVFLALMIEILVTHAGLQAGWVAVVIIGALAFRELSEMRDIAKDVKYTER